MSSSVLDNFLISFVALLLSFSVAPRSYQKWSKKESSDFSISTAEEVWRGCNFTGE